MGIVMGHQTKEICNVHIINENNNDMIIITSNHNYNNIYEILTTDIKHKGSDSYDISKQNN